MAMAESYTGSLQSAPMLTLVAPTYGAPTQPPTQAPTPAPTLAQAYTGEPSLLSLFAELHKASLTRLATATGQRLQGLAQSASAARLLPKWRRKLCNLDALKRHLIH